MHVRTTGSHKHYHHPIKPGTVTIAGLGNDDIPKGTLNSMLKQELETKDCALQEAEDRLRRQEESIKRAYTDCDVQHQKIKKREMVISRVLKRLENINAIAGIADEAAFGNGNEHEHGLEGSTRF